MPIRESAAGVKLSKTWYNALKYTGRIARREWPPQQSFVVIIGTRPGCRQGRNEIAAVPFDPPGKLQSEQDRPHLSRRRLRRAGKFVNRNRHRPQKRDEAPLDVVLRPPGRLHHARRRGPVALVWRCAILRIGGRRPKRRSAHFGKIELVPQRLIPSAGLEKAGNRLCARQILLRQCFDDILRPGAERRAVAQQIVGGFRARIERRARHGKDFAALIGSEFRGDEGAGPARRLDDDDRPAKTRDNPVAARKITPPRLPAERHFADRSALFEELFKQGFMFGWVDIPQTARKDRDRPGLDRRLMRPRVDPAREAGDDDVPGAGKDS